MNSIPIVQTNKIKILETRNSNKYSRNKRRIKLKRGKNLFFHIVVTIL